MIDRSKSMRSRSFLILLACFASLAGCSDNKPYETAMCAIADTSGTYADQKQNVARIVKAGIISEMMPGDSLFFLTINSNSYNEENLRNKFKLDYIPSRANEQRLAFARSLDQFAEDPARAEYTDISGAMMLCSDYLKATGSGNRAMLIFSDMKEELKKGLKRDFSDDQLQGIHVAAMNVIKLNADSADPAVYRQRLAGWQKRLMNAGASSWDVIVDPVKIPDYLDHLR